MPTRYSKTANEYPSTDPLVVQYNSSFLPLTEVWIYNQLSKLDGVRHLFLCRSTQNLELFPSIPVCSLNKLPFLTRILQLVYFKLSGYIPRFATCAAESSILHVHFGYNGVKMTGLSRHLKIPMICSFYGIDAFSFPLQRNRNLKRLQQLFRNSDRILVLGPYMRDAIAGMGCPADKIYIHHLGVDLKKIRFEQRTRKPTDPVRFLMASSFIEKKGVDICLKALSSLKDQHSFSVDIIGDGPLKDQLISIIKAGGMEERVTFHGYRPYDYFIDLAYQCDVFLQASRTSATNDKEGTPMSIVDAMATGLPVVSTRHSDIPEIVQDGITGFLADENSVSSFQEAIHIICSRMDELSVFSENSRRHIEDHFNVEKQAGILRTMYLEVINSRHGDHRED
jgi:colanic acid/amylovoran biosynthesis glycosyltransferase